MLRQSLSYLVLMTSVFTLVVVKSNERQHLSRPLQQVWETSQSDDRVKNPKFHGQLGTIAKMAKREGIQTKEFSVKRNRGNDNNGQLKHVSPFRNFDEISDDITKGVKCDNAGPEKKCTCTTTGFIFCNCSYLGLHAVPVNLPFQTNGLKLMLEGLDFTGNKLNLTKTSPFKDHPELKYLSLQKNDIPRLRRDTFYGLGQLRVLDLKHNSLEMNPRHFPVGVFKELKSLVGLRINRNHANVKDPNLNYPDEALADLISLKVLSMDGLTNKSFGQDFERLTSLETLTLGGYLDGYCDIKSLSKETLKHLWRLYVLDLNNCHLQGKLIDNDTLSNFRQLFLIDMSWNPKISLKHMARILEGLKDTNLKKLMIRHIETRFAPGNHVHSDYLRNLPRNLTDLVVSGNCINRLDPDVIELLPSSLKYLDVSGNKLVFGNYLQNLTLLKNLNTLFVEGLQFEFHVPKYYQDQVVSSEVETELIYNTLLKTQSGMDDREKSSSFVFPIPPNLRKFSAENSGLRYYLSELEINSNNSLEELFLSYNYFTSLQGPFKGFHSLKTLTLAFCQIKYVSKDFFQNFRSLLYLNLSSNLIGLSDSLYYQPFRAMTNLKFLDLSFNAIYRMKNDSLAGLTALHQLNMGSNRFYEFNASITHMSQLKILDLNNTFVYRLTKKTYEFMDTLNKFTVYLMGDPLSCHCDNTEFLKWMINSKAIPKKNVEYRCIPRDSVTIIVPWTGFVELVRTVEKECAENYAVFLVVLAFTLLFLALIIGSVGYKFRWRLRYLYYNVYLWMSRGVKTEEANNYTYDVFLSYSSDDLNFVLTKLCPELRSRSISICVHSIDFVAGDNITTNIIRSIRQSRRTLIILTQNLLKSKWCRCEFQMAKEESLLTGRRILIFLLAEEIPKSKIGVELLTHIQQNTYLPYPGRIGATDQSAEGTIIASEEQMKTFWDRLARDLKTQ